MNRKSFFSFCIAAGITMAGLSCSERSIPTGYASTAQINTTEACAGHHQHKRHHEMAVVSADWLSARLECRNIAVVDVRSEPEFQGGHIPGSVNIPFIVPISTWITMTNGLLLEVPELSQFAADLGNKGISTSSLVVLVTSAPTDNNPYAVAFSTRAALTLAYAGADTYSILDGGFDAWVNEGKPVTVDPEESSPVTFEYDENADLFVSMEYVQANLGNFILIDARDADVYSGTVIEPYAPKAGHIPTAVSLPAPLLWNSDGTYKSRNEIKSIVKPVVGNGVNRETVIYCGVGGYASTVWFALTQILNYKNVKVYDGSAQEWVLTNDMQM